MRLNKYMLTQRIKEKINCTNESAKMFIEILSEIIFEEMMQDNEVSFGDLGVFSIMRRKERQGVNPSTKEKMKLKPTAQIKFRSFRRVKDLTTKKLATTL